MDRDAYYTKYLRSLDLRYFMSGQILDTHTNQAIVSIQRTRRQGHVERADVERMRVLLPHISQAYDVATRLRAARGATRTLEQALDWLGDGVALLRRDGRMTYANDALQAMARRNDGIRVTKGAIEFADADARSRFAAALGGVGSQRRASPHPVGAVDFFAARTPDALPYVVSLRPLATLRGETRDAVAIVFVHDPLGRAGGSGQLLRDLFGLTEAEAGLAQALQAGRSLDAHARERGISLNTVYTHLRRIKDKTGCSRLPELIQRLGDLHTPARGSRERR
jgi:DNA-binding CsgD family transcriptional regulator